MKTTMKRIIGAIVAPSILALAACGSNEEPTPDSEGMVEEINETLVGVLGSSDDHGELLRAIEESGLASIFDGPGSYTLLAPGDAAFEALDTDVDTLLEEEQRPILIGVLREHILPGHLTREAIEEALASNDGEVVMTTLGGGTVTFTENGGVVSVSNGGGASATLGETGLAANNGTVLPLDAVLVPGDGASA